MNPEPTQGDKTDRLEELRKELLEVSTLRREETPDGWQRVETVSVEDALEVFQQYIDSQIRLASLETADLLFWKYKELNNQSVDKKFIEAYNIITEELKSNNK